MDTGIVLIKVEPGEEQNIYEYLNKLNNSDNTIEKLEPYILFGEYDLIVKIEARDVDLIGRIIIDKIRNIPGVKSTHTLSVVRSLEMEQSEC